MIDFLEDWKTKYRNACNERDTWKVHYANLDSKLKITEVIMKKSVALNIFLVGFVAYLILM